MPGKEVGRWEVGGWRLEVGGWNLEFPLFPLCFSFTFSPRSIGDTHYWLLLRYLARHVFLYPLVPLRYFAAHAADWRCYFHFQYLTLKYGGVRQKSWPTLVAPLVRLTGDRPRDQPERPGYYHPDDSILLPRAHLGPLKRPLQAGEAGSWHARTYGVLLASCSIKQALLGAPPRAWPHAPFHCLASPHTWLQHIDMRVYRITIVSQCTPSFALPSVFDCSTSPSQIEMAPPPRTTCPLWMRPLASTRRNGAVLSVFTHAQSLHQCSPCSSRLRPLYPVRHQMPGMPVCNGAVGNFTIVSSEQRHLAVVAGLRPALHSLRTRRRPARPSLVSLTRYSFLRLGLLP